MSIQNTIEEREARLMQMKINTRLTALQSAQTLMGTPGYNELGGTVDHSTLLLIASQIETYIIGDLEQQAKEALDKVKNPPPSIIKVRQ